MKLWPWVTSKTVGSAVCECEGVALEGAREGDVGALELTRLGATEASPLEIEDAREEEAIPVGIWLGESEAALLELDDWGCETTYSRIVAERTAEPLTTEKLMEMVPLKPKGADPTTCELSSSRVTHDTAGVTVKLAKVSPGWL